MIRPSDLLIPVKVSRSQEVIRDRRINGKTFHVGGNRYQTVTCTQGISHYKNDMKDENESFKEIDLSVDKDGCCVKAPYKIKIYKDRVGYSYVSRTKGRVDVELIEVDGLAVDNTRFTVRQKDNMLFWDNVSDDVDMKIELRAGNAEIFKSLKTDIAARSFTWLIREDVDSSCHFSKITEGRDSSSDERWNMEIKTVVGLGEIRKSTETGREFNEYTYKETWTGRVSKIKNRNSRQKAWTNKIIYPCLIDASTSEDITNTADDGYSGDNYGVWSSGPCYAGNYGTNVQNAGFRFQTLGVPQGAAIDSAEIQLGATNIVGTPQLKLYADDVDDAPAWSNSSRPASGFTKTTASKAWSPTFITGTGGVSSIPITSIIQEIVGRNGWASGNDIRIAAFDQVGTGNNYAGIRDYPHANAATLVVNYTVSSGDVAVTLPISVQALGGATGAINIPSLAIVAGNSNASITLPISVSASRQARGIALFNLPRLDVSATGLQGHVESATISLPAFTINITSGLTPIISLPKFAIFAEGENGYVGTFGKSLPRMIVNVKASQASIVTLISSLPQFNFNLTGLQGIVSVSAGNRTLPIFSINAHAFRGENGDANISLPILVLTTEVALNPNVDLNQSLFMLTLDAYADVYTNRII